MEIKCVVYLQKKGCAFCLFVLTTMLYCQKGCISNRKLTLAHVAWTKICPIVVIIKGHALAELELILTMLCVFALFRHRCWVHLWSGWDAIVRVTRCLHVHRQLHMSARTPCRPVHLFPLLPRSVCTWMCIVHAPSVQMVRSFYCRLLLYREESDFFFTR